MEKINEYDRHSYIGFIKKKLINEYTTPMWYTPIYDKTETLYPPIINNKVGDEDIKWMLNIYDEDGAMEFQRAMYAESENIFGCDDTDLHYYSQHMIFGKLAGEILTGGISQFVMDYNYQEIVQIHDRLVNKDLLTNEDMPFLVYSE